MRDLLLAIRNVWPRMPNGEGPWERLPELPGTFHLDPDKPAMCENCGVRPATTKWVGAGGALALAHGFEKDWCDQCVLRAQIEHCEAMATLLPGLRARLALLEDHNAGNAS